MAVVNVRKETSRLYIDFRFKGIRCREQTALRDTLSNRRVLNKHIDKMNAEMVLGIFNYGQFFPNSPKAATFLGHEKSNCESKRFVNFTRRWMAEMAPSWRCSYLKTMQYLVDSKLLHKFGNRYVSDISKEDILAYRSELAATRLHAIEPRTTPLSSRYVNRVIGLLMNILTEASVRYKFNDPCIGVKPLPVRKKSVLPFALHEVETIVNNAPNDYKDYFIIRLFTGLRTGELHGLRWENVRFDDRQVFIKESMVDGVLGDTKSARSDRIIDMSDVVHDAFQRVLENSECSEFVFTRKGAPFTQSFITQSIWYPLLTKLNLRKRRPYEMRHTAATLWLASGENPEWIARQLGHANTQILFDTYSNYVPNLTRRDGSEANKLFNQLTVEVNL